MTLPPALVALHGRARRHVPGARLPSPLSEDDVRHLVRRLTWGATPALLDEVRRDPQGWLDAQLEPASVADGTCEGYVARFARLRRSVTDIRTHEPFGAWDTMWELGQATLARFAWSRRQLLEVMVDFWSNHLHVTSPSSDVWDNRHDYDATVVRRHALGSFDQMLAAAARHPAVLRYLDGASSTKAAPNENFAREVMELHTVGVGAGYGEAGVRAAARVFTGMTVDEATGLYRYDPARHDTSAATVLDWSAPAHAASQGEAVAADLLRHLALHPATAAALARKLCVRFVADSPPQALVDRLAAVYRAQGSAITPVLRALFASPEFWASRGQKTRRPLEGFVAAVRVVGSTPGPDGLGGMDDLYWQTMDFGQLPMYWGPPNGYPDVAAAWASSGATLGRWNQTTAVANGIWPTKLTRPAPQTLLPSPRPATHGALVDGLVVRVLGRGPTPRERTALLGFCGRAAGDPLPADSEWLTWHLPSLVTIVLNSPGHMER